MKILNIAYYTIKRNFRDRRSISLNLLFPVLLILILGTALNSAYSPKTMDKIKIAYVNGDRGQLGKQFDAFLKVKDIKELLEVKTINSYNDGMKLVQDKKASALIYINSDYSKNVMLGKASKIEVYQNQIEVLDTSVVKSIVDSFINRANTMEALAKMGETKGLEITGSSIKNMPITKNGNIPRALDYYAVTMLAMALMYGTLFASFGMAEDKYEKTYIRIKSSPTKDYVNYLGKTLGIFATLFLEVVILIGFTKYAYHVNWGSNIPMVLLLSALFAVFATGLGIMAYALTNSNMRASALLNILTVVLTFVSGGYAKLGDTGSLFDKIVFFAPNKMFQTAMFNTIYGGPNSQTQTCILGLVGITVIIFAISSIAGRRVLN